MVREEAPKDLKRLMSCHPLQLSHGKMMQHARFWKVVEKIARLHIICFVDLYVIVRFIKTIEERKVEKERDKVLQFCKTKDFTKFQHAANSKTLNLLQERSLN